MVSLGVVPLGSRGLRVCSTLNSKHLNQTMLMLGPDVAEFRGSRRTSNGLGRASMIWERPRAATIKIESRLRSLRSRGSRNAAIYDIRSKAESIAQRTQQSTWKKSVTMFCGDENRGRATAATDAQMTKRRQRRWPPLNMQSFSWGLKQGRRNNKHNNQLKSGCGRDSLVG